MISNKDKRLHYIADVVQPVFLLLFFFTGKFMQSVMHYIPNIYVIWVTAITFPKYYLKDTLLNQTRMWDGLAGMAFSPALATLAGIRTRDESGDANLTTSLTRWEVAKVDEEKKGKQAGGRKGRGRRRTREVDKEGKDR